MRTFSPSIARHFRAACFVLAASTASFVALAADTGPSASTTPDKLAAARELIQQNKWVAAIDELKRVDDRASADWNNLMGYSHRKAKVPDYAAAERYYDEALRIDPKHKGALEYSGELYLMLNQLPKAEARLATLDKACFLPCGEYTELKNAIAAYKANGNQYAAKQ
ncbi:MAG TPA: tetratricopeptide repeat protein [Ideonella sp.]|nr:tetratricopeptide repeat protein [Ideonella sp.]